jgi:hypothetical protein
VVWETVQQALVKVVWEIVQQALVKVVWEIAQQALDLSVNTKKNTSKQAGDETLVIKLDWI